MIRQTQNIAENENLLIDNNESLSFGDLEINPIDKDGDFEIIIGHYDGNAFHYLTTDEAKKLIAFLQQGLYKI